MINLFRRLIVIIAAAICVYADIQAQDYGYPDTVRYSTTRVGAFNCPSGVSAEIRFYLAADYYYDVIRFDIDLGSPIGIDSVTLLNDWAALPGVNTHITSLSGSIMRVYIIFRGLTLTSAGECAAIHFHLDPADTIIAEIRCDAFILGNVFFDQWTPRICELGETPPMYANTAGIPGDADLSGQVTISDAVFTILYIFGGGCEAPEPNSTDVNGDCVLSISDAVFLINYIFAGGGPPLPGCIH